MTLKIEIKHGEFGLCSEECHLARYDRATGICSCPFSTYYDGDNPSAECKPGMYEIVPDGGVERLRLEIARWKKAFGRMMVAGAAARNEANQLRLVLEKNKMDLEKELQSLNEEWTQLKMEVELEIDSRKWHKTKEEVPSEDDTVLVRTANGKGFFIAWWVNDWKAWCEVGSRDRVKLDHPVSETWWMRIPE